LFTVNDLLSRLRKAFTVGPSPPSSGEARQRVRIDRTGLSASLSIRDVLGLLRAFLWTAVILAMTQVHVFPIFTLAYKDVFCDYITGDCENRYGIPRFEMNKL
jgi:hypothetical protein